MHGWPGSEHMHFNLEHRLYTLQIYVVWKSRVEIGHTFMEIYCRFYRFFLNRNAIPFYFRFPQKMLPHRLSYSKSGLFRLKNCDDFPRCSFICWLEDTMRNAWKVFQYRGFSGPFFSRIRAEYGEIIRLKINCF